MVCFHTQEISTEVAVAPSLGLAGTHTTYVAIMMDFSVETTGSTGLNATLLHWILAGLSAPNETTTLTTHQGEIAPYFPPGPPTGQTHTYGVFLYNEPVNFAIPADYILFFNNLTTSVFNRVGFNLTKFVAETGLGAPVAADWFLVTTPNTAVSSTVAATSASSAAISATATISVMGTNTGASAGSSSSTPSSPSTTQNSSGAMVIEVESIVVVIGALGFLVSLF
jgi:Phosphatidylethanolamine-binding protein